MKQLKIKLLLGNEIAHTSQLLVALDILKEKGLIELSIESAGIKSVKSYCACIVNDKKLIFDFHDRPTNVFAEQYEWCDFYVKRSVMKDALPGYTKIHAWGLNVFLDPPANFAWYLAKNKTNLKEAVKTYVSSSPLLSSSVSTVIGNLSGIKNRRNGRSWKNFQQKPIKTNNPKIIFTPKIWNLKNSITGEIINERYQLNATRIECVRILRKHFPAHYDGGVEDTPEAKSECPDLIIQLSKSHKMNYIKQLEASSIGISTVGIAYSVGWKFSEYILFSKAIVSNDLENYVFNYPIKDNLNYLGFSDMDKFLTSVELLVRDDNLRYEMMQENYNYSQNYLMPDKQLLHAFKSMNII